MKFSVLMSVYHKEDPENFDMALHSILVNQTMLPNDFVLVCDGPLTKELDSVIEKYCSLCPEILKVHRLEKNGGLGNALNYGLSLCKCDLVARADSDDVCVPTRFETQVAYMQSNPQVAVCSSDIAEFESNPQKPQRIKRMPQEHGELYKMAKFRNPINHMAAMVRKKVIEEVGSYIHLHYLEDYYLWLRVLCSGYELGNIGQVLVHARVGNGMVQRRGSKQYISGWNTLSKYMMKHKMIGLPGYCKNMICVSAFVFIPPFARDFLYNKILRKR